MHVASVMAVTKRLGREAKDISAVATASYAQAMTPIEDKEATTGPIGVFVSCLHRQCRMAVHAATLEDLARQVKIHLGRHLDDFHPELHSDHG